MQKESGDPVIIIGAGPAGLAAAETLAKRNVAYLILEKGSSVADALRRVDPEMRLLSPKGLSLMPDMQIAADAPTYLPFATLVHELERYQQQYDLNVTLDCMVKTVSKDANGFVVRYRKDGNEHEVRGSHVVNATGIISNPRLPDNFHLEPRHWRHSVDVRAEDLAAARQLLVVGGGASAAEVFENWLRVRREGDRAWLSLRSKLCAVPHWILGIDLHYFAWLPEQLPTSWFGWRAGRLTEPMSGREVVKAIRSGLIKLMPQVSSYHGSKVEFVDGQQLEPDLIVFATGFSYAREHLKEVVDFDPDGRPLVKNCESTRTRGVFLLGYRFGRTFASPYLRGIARDAEFIAKRIAEEKRLR
ncbi:MAG TPA: NAD(P)-binding domain-containing protein [Pyrinomonadaceae bacterium]|nr:NAD(P)-binding domain-containing protein [Pyrinomonadaceae bacterium]